MRESDLVCYRSTANDLASPNLKQHGTSCFYDWFFKADVYVVNDKDHESLYEQLKRVDLTRPERLRPSWDDYFMVLAELTARRSNCMKRRVGAILVRDTTIVATGYNGTPRLILNCNEGGCGRCNQNAGCGQHLDICLCLHAEENALLEAGRERARGGTIYCSTCPCLGCAKKIVQVGIREVVYSSGYGMDDLSSALFAAAGIGLRQYRQISVPRFLTDLV